MKPDNAIEYQPSEWMRQGTARFVGSEDLKLYPGPITKERKLLASLLRNGAALLLGAAASYPVYHVYNRLVDLAR